MRNNPYNLVCVECGSPFVAYTPNKKCCSIICFRKKTNRETKEGYWNLTVKIDDKYGVLDKQTYCGNCCDVFKSHAEILKDDPERLSTDFIKKLSQCRCDEV